MSCRRPRREDKLSVDDLGHLVRRCSENVVIGSALLTDLGHGGTIREARGSGVCGLFDVRAELLELDAVTSAPDFEAAENDAEVLAARHAETVLDGVLDEVVQVEGQRRSLGGRYVGDT